MDILMKLNGHRKEHKYCDLTLVTGDSVHKAHKFILAASCDYFSQALNADSSTINVDFINSDDLDIILNYIYTEEICLTDENVGKLADIAHKLSFTKLEDCCKMFQENFNESPSAKQAEVGDMVNSNCTSPPSSSIEAAELVHSEIRRSKPVSIIPMTKRSERKAKQDAYKTMQIIEDFEDGVDDGNKNNRISSDEDYNYEAFAPAPLRSSKRRRSSRTKAYLCPTCNKCFVQALTYQFHLLSHDDNPNDCNEVVINSSKLKENMERVENEKCGIKPEIIPRKAHLTCEICLKMFTTAHNLTVHMTTHKKLENDEKSKAAKKQHPCTDCPKVFASRSHLRRHMLSHTGVRKYCCTTCGKLFLKNDHLKRHERTHSNERPFACEECGKMFRDKDHLKRHHLTHSDERPFFCEICGKQFKERNTLQSHLKVHSTTTLACTHCSKTFKTDDALQRHIARHERENPHVCEVCGKNFPFVGRLKKHMLTHTGDRPHHCETCGKQFRDAHSLKLHQKKHTGIGLHPCQECGKEFTNPFHLKRHERVHTGEKPFSCDICKRTFSRLDNLEAHKRSCLMKQQGTELSAPVSQVWTDKNSSLIPERSEAVKENEMSLSLSASPAGNTDPSSSIVPSPSPGRAQSSFLPQCYPTLSATLPSVSMITNPSSLISDDFTRSKLYTLPNPLFSPQQNTQSSSLEAYQQSGVQMPTPLQANTQNIIHSSQQQQQQQILNFDVSAAVNAFIGYGHSM